MTYADMYA